MSNQNQQVYWYAVYTRPNREKRIAEQLSQRGVVVYCPLQKVIRQWSDRKKTLEIPAFRGYVFVQIHDAIRWEILATDGIINFVCHEGKPARIPAQEIETVRRFFQDISDIPVDETDIRVNDIARVYSGVLMGMEGEVVDVKNRFAILKIPTLGIQIQVKVAKENIQVIRKSKSSNG
ncbi:MAG: UpxY family transcription antiterminator [Bacteroidetes bacterium]|nr:UpxY family transcription antiterminator [Bacteroidota bacterium]